MSQNAEDTPLLLSLPSGDGDEVNCSTPDQHFLHALDSELDPDHVLDHPPSPNVRKVTQHLLNACSTQGIGHGTAHSPALLLRLRQSVDHGFRNVWSSVTHIFPKKNNPETTNKSVPHLQHQPSQRDRVRYANIRTVLVIAVLTMIAMMSVSPTLLLYMNELGFTSPTNISPYVIASSLSTAVPIVSNIALTSLASKVGPGMALAYGSLVSLFGLFCLVMARKSLLLFMIGFGLYTSNNSFRVVRVSLLSKVVAPEHRTTVLATHALMTPLGAMAGPLIWIAAQTYRGSTPFLNGIFVFDRFSINYIATLFVLLAIYILSTTKLRHIIPYATNEEEEEDTEHVDGGEVNNSGADENEGQTVQPVIIHFADGHQQTVDLRKYRSTVFIFFCAINVGVNLSAGCYMLAFQPVLVNEFHMPDSMLGIIYEVIAVFAVIPPLAVAILSRKLMDRHILVIGLIIKVIGMALFLPIFGPVKEWQIIVGYLLIIKASIFFSTASMSLFTKVLGPMSTSSLLGLLASSAAIGPAVVQILLSDLIINWFGSFKFGLFALPGIASLLAILYPMQWRRLDSNCEYTTLVTREAEVLQSK